MHQPAIRRPGLVRVVVTYQPITPIVGSFLGSLDRAAQPVWLRHDGHELRGSLMSRYRRQSSQGQMLVLFALSAWWASCLSRDSSSMGATPSLSVDRADAADFAAIAGTRVVGAHLTGHARCDRHDRPAGRSETALTLNGANVTDYTATYVDQAGGVVGQVGSAIPGRRTRGRRQRLDELDPLLPRHSQPSRTGLPERTPSPCRRGGTSHGNPALCGERCDGPRARRLSTRHNSLGLPNLPPHPGLAQPPGRLRVA